MKRNKTPRKADAIFTADWHLRDSQPVARTDDFEAAQWNKVNQVAKLQRKDKCPVYHAGDLFHKWKTSPYLLSKCFVELPDLFYTVYGNHDMPQHNLELEDKSGVNVLATANRLAVLDSGSFGQEPGHVNIAGRKVGIWHEFVWDGKKIPWPGCDEMTADEVLKKYPDFDLIVTGDHHKPFVVEKGDRKLLNCGCLTRQAADYAHHRPVVWLYYAEDNSLEPHYLDAADGVVTRQHLEKKEETDKRLEAFISKLQNEWEISVSFEENLERFFSTNKVKKSVKEIVYQSID